jgi:hypothetical protein
MEYTTRKGFENAHGQTVLGQVYVILDDRLRQAYVLQCGSCSQEYGTLT